MHGMQRSATQYGTRNASLQFITVIQYMYIYQNKQIQILQHNAFHNCVGYKWTIPEIQSAICFVFSWILLSKTALGETNLLLTIACVMGFHSPNGFDINTPGLVTTVVAITKQYETFQGITNIQHVQESVAYLLPAGFTITAVIDRFTALTSQAPTNPSAPQVAPGQSPPLPRSSQQHVVVLPLVASSSPPHPLPGNAQQGSTEWLHCHTDFVNSVG